MLEANPKMKKHLNKISCLVHLLDQKNFIYCDLKILVKCHNILVSLMWFLAKAWPRCHHVPGGSTDFPDKYVPDYSKAL